MWDYGIARLSVLDLCPSVCLSVRPSVCLSEFYLFLFISIIFNLTFVNSNYHLLLVLELITVLLSCGLFIIRASYHAHSSSIRLLMCAS